MVHAFRSMGPGAIGDALFDGRIVAFGFRCEVAIGLSFCDQLVSRGSMLVGIRGLKNQFFVVRQSQPFKTVDN